MIGEAYASQARAQEELMVIITNIQNVLKYLEKLRKKLIEASKASIKMAEKSKEEVNANKELCDS